MGYDLVGSGKEMISADFFFFELIVEIYDLQTYNANLQGY